MILPRGQPLLLPANPWFIWGSLAAALLLMLVPLGRLAWKPDLLAVVLVFWVIHQPRRVGIAAAFAFGLAMDVHEGALLGQHALAYTVLVYGAIALHRRVLWFSVAGQAVQVLPLFALAHLLALIVRLAIGGDFPGWPLLLAPLLEAAAWPIITLVLLAPQRRAPDPDENRPL